MLRTRILSVLIVFLLVFSIAACGGDSPSEDTADSGSVAEVPAEQGESQEDAVEEAAETSEEEATDEENTSEEDAAEEAADTSEEAATDEEQGEETASEEDTADSTSSDEEVAIFVNFDPNNFDENSAQINNEWLPLQPGNHWVHEGVSIEDDERIPHRIEFTVTDLTKQIAGVKTAVAWILDYSEDELVEAELSFYAQDKEGNVWYLGEYPEEYEDGELVGAPGWIAGLEDAKAGLKMMAEPQVETDAYFQGWAPAVEWTDYGQITEMGAETCVPVDCYDDVLLIDESSLEEVDIYQVKYYARNVGNIQVGWKGEPGEELELVEFSQLNADEQAEVRTAALELEASAYENDPDVYGETMPME